MTMLVTSADYNCAINITSNNNIILLIFKEFLNVNGCYKYVNGCYKYVNGCYKFFKIV